MKPASGRDIICPECPKIYGEVEITAFRGDESKPLVEILGKSPGLVDRQKGQRRAIKRLFGREPGAGKVQELSIEEQKHKLGNLERLKDWQFRCPAGHLVDGNRGHQLPIAVVGPSG